MSVGQLTILFDNRTRDSSLKSGWGFSCLVEVGEAVMLFDTAWDGDQVIYNATKLGCDLQKVNSIFISHQHWDHQGGLAAVLNRLSRPLKVFLPAAASTRFQDELQNKAVVVPIDGATALGPGLYSTGQLESNGIFEQALVIAGKNGVTLLTGCAHPGLPALLEAAAIHGPVHTVVGGFHDFTKLQLLAGIERIYPCHCTKDIPTYQQRLSGSYRSCHAGTVVELE